MSRIKGWRNRPRGLPSDELFFQMLDFYRRFVGRLPAINSVNPLRFNLANGRPAIGFFVHNNLCHIMPLPTFEFSGIRRP